MTTASIARTRPFGSRTTRDAQANDGSVIRVRQAAARSHQSRVATAGSDAGGTRTTAVRDGNDWVLNGSKMWITNSHYAHALIITAKTDLEAEGSQLLNEKEDEAITICAKFAAAKILEGIKQDLADFGVEFDQWFSEQSLYDTGRVQKAISEFKEKELIYEKDKALWFKTEDFGDEKDRVVVRNNGLTTYFASDIAYHMEK